MGLRCSHDAFEGSYSAFNRLRQCVCRSLGSEGSYGPHYLLQADGQYARDESGLLISDPALDDSMFYVPDMYERASYPGLWEFLSHSDCDGEISPDMCLLIAQELELLLPAIEALNWSAGSHIAAVGGFKAATQRFIRGCRAANAAGEPLRFR